MIDSHSHVSRCPDSPEKVIGAARETGVERILTVGLDEASNREQIALCEQFDGLFAAVGRHPNDADGFDDAAAADLEQLAAHPKVVAIGETGLDFFRDTAEPDSQRLAFIKQADIAARLDLPLVIHCRDQQGRDDAVSEIFATLEEFPDLTVILHCFSAPDWVERAAERDWYCSFAGNVTYPANEDLRTAAARVPADRIMVETDAPYLTPQSRRRDRNQPAFVVETAELVAGLRGIDYAELDELVTANAARVYGW
ncbi:MAG TPA: TatD family hydrolase [Solirubrobacterales bacterium]|nr:TatD family hydrolase [Solirubrobacterales bacterium]HMX70572.1 TatD family hydrolase [Solirubrobacterales bacterium]HNI40430.1 TatD family hydrolase [Solirubrobacterales bacterium]HNL62042.1 TatD family hydrolase [Solirubrobacterales bacterium]HNN20273.1 TatD family hydrolase [Solirubrobacterales bacterium]